MKRRVNTKFLTILTAVIVCLGVAAVVGKMLWHEKPEKYVKMAEGQMQQGNYENAAKDYGTAFGLGGQHNLDLLMKQAEAWQKLAETEPAYINRVVACWTKSLEINRTYVPALKKLMAFWDEQAKGAGTDRPAVYAKVRDYAERLAAADPSDKDAAAKVPVTIVQGWLVGSATEPKTLDDAFTSLTKLQPQDPTNPEIPTVLAEGYLKKAQEASHRADAATADKMVKQASDVFAQALKGQDSNVEMQARAAAIHSFLVHLARTDEDRKKYKDEMQAEIDRVCSEAKPTDEAQTDELISVATLMAQNGDSAGSEKVMKGLTDARPDDPAVRLAYARVLSTSPEGRTRAIALLSAPISPKGASPARIRQYESQMLFDLSNLQLEQYGELKEPAERDALIKQVDENLAKLQQKYSDSPAYLRMRGQIQLIKGQDTDAIQTFVHAQSILQQQGRVDDQLSYSLSGAYLKTRQTGAAKKLLSDMLQRRPDFVPARRALAQLFLSENDPDDAEPHVAFLEKALPNDPEVKRERIAILVARKQPEEARKIYDNLPEGDNLDKIRKAQVALGIGNNDDAVRLLELVRHADPKNVTIVRMLVMAHRARNDMASARRVVDEAVLANPTDLSLVGLQKQLSGATGEEMVKFTRDAVEKNPDAYTREIQLAAIATDEGNAAESLEHLKKAEQIKPDDRQVQEALFQTYLKDHKWDLAGQYADKLTKANADRAGGALYKFRLQMAQGQYAAALATAQDLASKMPEFAQTWVTLAQAQQATGHLDAAVQAYLRALEKQSDSTDAMRGLIDCYYMQNQPDDALRYINLARRTFPSNGYFKDLELRHVMRYGDPDQAVAQCQDVLKQNPDVRANWANLSQAMWRALVARQTHNDTAGIKKYADALTNLSEDGIKKWPDEQLFYAYLADLASLRNDMNAGVDALKRLAAQPAWKGKPEPALLLADYYSHFSKFTEAEASATHAVELAGTNGGDDTGARQKLASIQAADGHIDDAIKTLDAAKSANSTAVERQKLLLLVGAHRMDSAEKMALSLLAKDPKASDLINILVSIYLETNQYDQALARVNEVLTTDPNNLGALYGRGLVYLRRPKPDVDAAIADLKTVRDKDSQNAEARYWLAEAYVAKGSYDSAISELETAIKLQPAAKQLRLRMVQVCAAATPPRWVDAERVLTEGRAIPSMAADPDMAIAEVRMWIARRQADKAVDVARQAVNVSHGNMDVVRAYLDAMLASGSYQRLLDETTKAVANGDTAPWWALQDRAIALRRLDKKDEALAEFEKALNTKEVQQHDDIASVVLNSLAQEVGIDEALTQVAPKAEGNPRWQLLQAYLYQQKHDWPNAVATVDKMMTEVDKMPADQRLNVLRFAGTMYLSAQPKPMPEKALSAFKLSLKEFPDDTAVLNNVASLLTDYVDPARPQEALQYSQHAYDLMTKSGRIEPLVLDTQGRVLTMVNRVPEGIVLLQEAADRTDIPDVHYHLAEAYMMQNAPEEAQKHLIQASAAIEKATKAQQSVDPKMIRRVQELTAQAKKIIESKAQAGAR